MPSSSILQDSSPLAFYHLGSHLTLLTFSVLFFSLISSHLFSVAVLWLLVLCTLFFISISIKRSIFPSPQVEVVYLSLSTLRFICHELTIDFLNAKILGKKLFWNWSLETETGYVLYQLGFLYKKTQSSFVDTSPNLITAAEFFYWSVHGI